MGIDVYWGLWIMDLVLVIWAKFLFTIQNSIL